MKQYIKLRSEETRKGDLSCHYQHLAIFQTGMQSTDAVCLLSSDIWDVSCLLDILVMMFSTLSDIVPSQEWNTSKPERPRHTWLRPVPTSTTHCRLSSLGLTGMDNSQRHSHNNFGDQRSATAGWHLWNLLPSKLRHYDSLEEFKQLMKTHLFEDYSALSCLVKSTIYKSSYLLT